MLTAQQFSSLATATIVECLWVAFYVTGDRRYIRRLVQLTAMWKQVAHLSPDMGGVPPPLEAQLPASIEVRHLPCGPSGRNDAPTRVRRAASVHACVRLCAVRAERVVGGERPSQGRAPRVLDSRQPRASSPRFVAHGSSAFHCMSPPPSLSV